MKNKIVAILVLVLLAATVIYFNSKHKDNQEAVQETSQPDNRPLPQLTSAQQRVSSYTPVRGDFKYRLIQKPQLSVDQATLWNAYTSKEYSFTFIYPTSTVMTSTESLGYQLPPNQAYKNSRDNFQIEISSKHNSFFFLFLNYPDFHVDNTTTTAVSKESSNGLSLTKTILQSTLQKFATSEIIEYSFEKSGKSYIWYGTFDATDVESINDFESIVQSMKFSN